MEVDIKNWMTQIKKGYLEICILSLIENFEKMYGFQIISMLEKKDISVKEGTLYPLLNRMTKEKILKSSWDLENNKGHPRKFYALTPLGIEVKKSMDDEFERIINIYNEIKQGENNG